MRNSLVFIANCLFLYVNYFIWKKTHKNSQKSVVQNLRTRRLTVMEADEDLLFIFKSVVRVVLLAMEFFLFYLVVMRCLYNINVLNFMTLLVLWGCFFVRGGKGTGVFLGFLCFTVTVRYLAHFDFLKPKLDNQFFLLFGLFFQRHPL